MQSDDEISAQQSEISKKQCIEVYAGKGSEGGGVTIFYS